MKTIAILGTPGFVPNPERFGPEEMLAVLGQNAGNLMFQYAATELIAAPGIHVGKSGTPYASDAVAAVDVIVVPMANHFRLGADWLGFARFLESSGKPLIVLGLGAQAPAVDYEAEAIDALVADPEVRRLADRIREQAIFTTLRGSFTKRVCDALGIGNTHVLGCPSLLINPDPWLGRSIADRLERVRAGSGPYRFGIAAAAPFEIRTSEARRQVERRLMRWGMTHDALYVQQSGGVAVFNFSSGSRRLVPEKAQASLHRILSPGSEPDVFFDYVDRRGRLFTDAREWMREVGELDFVIGSRLHGVMAAIAAGVPGIVISHDSRTSELERQMRLPSVTMDDIRAPGPLGDKLAAVRFDPDAFDAHRASARGTLARLLTDALGEGSVANAHAPPTGVHT